MSRCMTSGRWHRSIGGAVDHGRSIALRLGVAMALAPGVASAVCVPDADTLCLQGNRFAVEVDWEDAAMTTGQGQVLPVGADGFGFFSLADLRYLELMVKVIDGCSFNGFYWVFASGLSDFEQTLTVTDTIDGGVAVYPTSAGVPFGTITDTQAIGCPAELTSATASAKSGVPVLSLVDGRFRVEVSWEASGGLMGVGHPVAVTGHSGYFWLFAADNPELIVKLVDGSGDDGFFQVAFGATTNVGYSVHVTDDACGVKKIYAKPLGVSPETVVDETAFLADCEAIFADGFESGNLAAWSSSSPPSST